MKAALLSILHTYLSHTKKHFVYVCVIFLAILTSSAGLSSIALVSSAAIKSLDAPPFSIAYLIDASKEQKLSLEDYSLLRKNGSIDTFAFDSYKKQLNDSEFNFVGIDTFALMNNKLQVAFQQSKSATQSPATAALFFNQSLLVNTQTLDLI